MKSQLHISYMYVGSLGPSLASALVGSVLVTSYEPVLIDFVVFPVVSLNFLAPFILLSPLPQDSHIFPSIWPMSLPLFPSTAG